jgi:hypothetical protein
MVTGLLGDFDGNPSNDLILPYGSVLEPNATEEAIFRAFNMACKYQLHVTDIDNKQRIFYHT